MAPEFVTVSTSLLMAVVMPVPPAIFTVSPVLNCVPVESSPTTVKVELVKYGVRSGPVIVNTSPLTAVVMF